MPDLGRYRVEVSPGTPKEEDYFVNLIMPIADGESPPAFEWFEEASYYGVRFGGEEFRIHKTIDQALWSGADTQPPAAPQNLAAEVGPGSGQVTLTWDPNTDDAVKYRGYYRTSGGA